MFEEYRAAPTISRFIKCPNRVVGIMGPFGSGKSVGCIIKVFLNACNQTPKLYRGRLTRRAKTVVVRNTYQELEDTTMETWNEWFPFELGKYSVQKKRIDYLLDLGDGTLLEWIVLFRSLDKPKDIKKLKSLEITNAWINEAKEVPHIAVTTLAGRFRYPPRSFAQPVNPQIVMDTNPPDDDNWWYVQFEESDNDWKIFKQPSGLSPNAENLENLADNYYHDMAIGQASEWIDVFIHAKYGHLTDGRPVYSEFNEQLHIASAPLEPIHGYPIYVGLDFGLTPAAVFAQDINGQWRVIDEIVTFNTSALEFGPLVRKKLLGEYNGFEVIITGDPAGNHRSEADKNTPFLQLEAEGISATPAYTNDFDIRRGALAALMLKLTMSGEPAFMVSPKCRYYVKGLRGGYRLNRLQVVGEERYHDVPVKNKFSHVCEADQYGALGAGYGEALLGNRDDWGTKINTRRENRR